MGPVIALGRCAARVLENLDAVIATAAVLASDDRQLAARLQRAPNHAAAPQPGLVLTSSD